MRRGSHLARRRGPQCNNPVAEIEITGVRSIAIGFRDRRKDR
jgi:hypothetical protein